MATGPALADTDLLAEEGDLAAAMVAGIERYLRRATAASIERRARHWKRAFTSRRHYLKSIEPNRTHFQRLIGLVDQRLEPDLQVLNAVPLSGAPATRIGKGAGYSIYAARWSALPGVDAEGLLLQPDAPPRADIIALPDCDWTPEMLVGLEPGVPPQAQFARRLAECGCRVLVPLLIDRRDTYSGIPRHRMTNQPHREFIYRAAFELAATSSATRYRKSWPPWIGSPTTQGDAPSASSATARAAYSPSTALQPTCASLPPPSAVISSRARTSSANPSTAMSSACSNNSAMPNWPLSSPPAPSVSKPVNTPP